MITAIIYDKVPNTQLGVMGGIVRRVGDVKGIYGGPDKEIKLLSIVEGKDEMDRPTVVLEWEDGMRQVIPDRGVEKYLKIEDFSPNPKPEK